ncbi:MAG TPA: helix-turn-helix domain-containing protein [Solirubrobacterales bacterium]|nr:helix-turn-helix domain-containing protein [Solirubrobacterales bacterium]
MAERPLPLPALREAIGFPAPSTLRGNLESLSALGALAVRRREGKSNQYDNSLTPLGEELLGVADAIEAWLSEAPAGPFKLGDSASKAAIGALIDGWDAAIVRELAPRPRALAELNDLISDVSYPTLSRRLAAMHLVGQVERRKLDGPKRVYQATDWLRRAVLPLGVAARCELRHLRETATPATRVEVESAFLLALPLAGPPEAVSGVCTLAVDTGIPGGRARLAGVQVEVRDGRVASCSTRLVEKPSTWAVGSVESWLDAAIAGDSTSLRVGGKAPDLPMGMVAAIHEALKGTCPPPQGMDRVLDKYVDVL